MTDPVDTDALRTQQWQNVDELVEWATAAADELDRLRKDLGTQQRVNADLVRAWDYEYDKVNQLRAVIENAPHQYPCPHQTRAWLVSKCTCWKADAL